MTTTNSMPKLLEQYQQRMKASAGQAARVERVPKYQLVLDNLPLKTKKEAIMKMLRSKELRFKGVEVLS